MIALSFVSGTLLLQGVNSDCVLPPSCIWDERTCCFRAQAVNYAPIVRALKASSIPFEDHCRKYTEFSNPLRVGHVSHPYQREALEAWQHAHSRGIVVLPTGAGKTHLAIMAIAARKRSALIVVPTLDLMRQWFDLLGIAFGGPIGLVGGGEYTVEPVTVITYDSAYMHMEHLGNRFGLVIFDECHHLPGGSYSLAACFCIAPYRLGLTATFERADGRERELHEWIGPLCYRKPIDELAGEYLAPYEIERVVVELSQEERAEYEAARAVYRQFIRSRGIRMGSAHGWQQFLVHASRGEEGRKALEAYRKQRMIAFRAPAKLDYLAYLFSVHRQDRMLIFTEDNATAYHISRRFLLPVLTHQSPVRERSAVLARFAEGEYTVLVTSKILNEGVDVPEANVAVVVSGSGSVREHVQRLGRVLRKREGKQARLIELVSGSTSEIYVSERRQENHAFR